MDDVETLQEDGTGDEAGTTVEETKEKDVSQETESKELDIDSMSEEELDKLDMSKLDEPEPEAEAKAKAEEKSETAEPEPEPEKKTDDAITHDPLKDTKAALTREQQKRAQLEKELAELKKQYQESRLKDFQELTQEELDDLKLDDPDAYVQYVLDSKEHEKAKQDIEAKAIQERQKNQYDEIVRFAEMQGVEVKDENKLSEFLSDEKFIALDKFVTDNFKVGDSGLYTTSQMEKAWKLLHFDEAVTEKAKAVRQEVLSNIEKAQNGGSKLDRMPKVEGAAKGRPAAELTAEDIDQMSEAEAEKALKELAGEM